MNKIILLIVSVLISAVSINAQCDPQLAPKYMTGCAPFEMVLNYSTTFSVTWEPGITASNDSSLKYTFATPAVYIVTVSVASGTCLGFATLTVNVVTGPANSCTNAVLGLQEVSNKTDFLIFPNPTSADLNLSISNFNRSDQFGFLITDSQGRTIRDETEYSNLISTNDLAPGLYFFHLKTTSGTVIKKFMKSE